MEPDVLTRDVILRDGSTLRLREPRREDEAVLVDFVARLSETSRRLRFHRAVQPAPALGIDLPEVAELDLNPVLGLPAGCVALDARVRLSRPVERPRTKTW